MQKETASEGFCAGEKYLKRDIKTKIGLIVDNDISCSPNNSRVRKITCYNK